MKINKKLMLSVAVLALSSTSVFASTVPNCDTLTTYKNQTVSKTTSYNQSDILNMLSNLKKSGKITVTIPSKNPTPSKGSGAVKNPGTTTPTTPVKTPTTPTTPGTPSTPVDNSVSAYESKVLELVNVERQKNGLSALKMDTALSNVARKKSEDMKAKNYFSHTSPTYGSPFDMMKQFGISYRTAGENIAMGQRTPQEVVTAWMNSPGHRANILNANFTHLGVGYVASGNYWTQMFIGK